MTEHDKKMVESVGKLEGRKDLFFSSEEVMSLARAFIASGHAKTLRVAMTLAIRELIDLVANPQIEVARGTQERLRDGIIRTRERRSMDARLSSTSADALSGSWSLDIEFSPWEMG